MPFYVPFTADGVYSVSAQSVTSAKVVRTDDLTLTLTLGAESLGAESLDFVISGFKNPFSRVKDSPAVSNRLRIQHLASCLGAPTPCRVAGCVIPLAGFKLPDQSTFLAPTATISPATGTTNTLGSSDGSITF